MMLYCSHTPNALWALVGTFIDFMSGLELKPNLNKSHIIASDSKCPHIPLIVIGLNHVTAVDNFTYLGVNFNTSGTWVDHV